MTRPQEKHSLHIVLSTMSFRQDDKYLEKIEQTYYNEYKRYNTKYYREDHELDQYLYKPVKYYLFGNYDIAFVSLIDSFKFTQNLFIPESFTNEEDDMLIQSNTFQSITGICLEHSGNSINEDLRNYFGNKFICNKCSGKTFISIINLKLNNGLVIGNGYDLLNGATQLIKKILDKHNKPQELNVDYFIIQSFSWFELSLIFFLDDVEILKAIICEIRSQTLANLGEDQAKTILDNSIYQIKTTDPTQNINSLHLFIDTQTYTGIQYNYLETYQNSDIKDKLQKIQFKTEIEWQLMPGYLGNLTSTLQGLFAESNGHGPSKVFNTKETHLLMGKSDYFFGATEHTLFDKVAFYSQLIKRKPEMSDYVKKVKSRILLKEVSEKSVCCPEHDFQYTTIARNLMVSSNDINDVTKVLKALKISRQLNNKIKKILFSYNNGIQDPVLFPYFLDFSIFITRFLSEIRSYHKSSEKHSDDKDNKKESSYKNYPVQNIEIKLIEYIDAFEKAYRIRALNSYQFEDINDLDLDFNSSLQQLLSIYNTIIIELSNLFYRPYKCGPIVQLNLNNTLANAITVNYNIYHLVSPEFIFSTILDEVLNPYRLFTADNPAINDKINKSERELISLLIKEPYFLDYKNKGLIEFNNFLLDAIRFVFIFNLNFKLFDFWFWTYALQNSSLFNNDGMLNEEHFKKELLRFIFLAKLFGFDKDINEDSCPMNELQSYWSRYYFDMSIALDKVFKGENKEAKETITGFKRLVIPMLLTALEQLDSPGLTGTKQSKSFEKLRVDFFYTNEFSTQDGPADDFSKWLLNRNLYLLTFSQNSKEKLKQGEPVYYKKEIHHNHHAFIYALIYTYLESIYEQNGKVHFLKRDCHTGEPIEAFIKNDTEEYLFSVDPLGGIFFYCPNQLTTYFKMRNALLQSLWHYSNLCKLTYIKSRI